MSVLNTLSAFFVWVWVTIFSGSCSKEEMRIDCKKALFPEQIFVKDVIRDDCEDFGVSSCSIRNEESQESIQE